MTRTWPALALAAIGFLQVELKSAQAQISVSGGLNGAVKPSAPKVDEAQSLRRRRRRRDRNPYYVARPVYPPAPPGARANITLEPFTSKYYPTENSYYPPLPVVPPTKVR